MLVNRDEVVCDECDKHIESFTEPRGWHNPLTAEAHVCEGCWMKECRGPFTTLYDVYVGIKENKLPVQTFIGRVIENNVTERIMEKFSVVS